MKLFQIWYQNVHVYRRGLARENSQFLFWIKVLTNTFGACTNDHPVGQQFSDPKNIGTKTWVQKFVGLNIWLNIMLNNVLNIGLNNGFNIGDFNWGSIMGSILGSIFASIFG